MKNLVFVTFSLLFLSLPVRAYDWSVVAVIKNVEPTRVPDSVQFKIDRDAGSCIQGSWLIWLGKTSDPAANVQAIYSAALSALTSGKRVAIYGTDECKLEYMHVLSD
ncbi:hypothetical protein GCM10008940_02320 [Microbulbifer agarilyticus]